MNKPGSSTAKIQDLIPRVVAALQNRQDVTESQVNVEMRPSRWIKDALRETTESLPFEELRQPNPPLVTIGPALGVALTATANLPSAYAYNVTSFVNPGDDVTLMEDPVIFLNPPSNSVPYPMEYLTPKAFTPLLVGNGTPYFYTRFGTQFWFAVPPSMPFQVYLPYQLRHPFNDDNVPISDVFVPPSWHDIIGYAAAERGAVTLRWNEQAEYLHKLLYGDPSAKGPRPGLITERVMQQERDRRLSTVQLTPSVQRY